MSVPMVPLGPSMKPTLRRISANLPTGGCYFGFPSLDPSDLESSWNSYSEGFEPQVDRLLQGIPCGKNEKLKEAYVMMDKEVWTEKNRTRRLAKAKEALKISSDCAEALYVIAELEAPSIESAAEMFKEATAAAERHLNQLEENYIERNRSAGKLFERPEMQPYMRCRIQWAHALRIQGKYEEAKSHYRDLAMLNQPMDHLGLKTCYLLCLLLAENFKEAIQLVAMLYLHNPGGIVPSYLFWADTFLTFVQSTLGRASEKLKKMSVSQAVTMCPLTFAYFVGEKTVPTIVHPFVTTGTEGEAMACARDYLPIFTSFPGVIDFLKLCKAQGVLTDPNFAKDRESSMEAKELGNKLFRAGGEHNLHIAMQHYATALKFIPVEENREKAILISNQSACLFELGVLEQSLSVAEFAMRVDPTYTKARVRKAQTLIRLGRKDEAATELRAILESDPSNEAARSLSRDL